MVIAPQKSQQEMLVISILGQTIYYLFWLQAQHELRNIVGFSHDTLFQGYLENPLDPLNPLDPRPST